MGVAGTIDSDRGVISIARDFPLWFVLCVIVHELVHYMEEFLPWVFCRKYRIGERNEFRAEREKEFLTPNQRLRTEFNKKQFLRYCSWIENNYRKTKNEKV